ncbi:MAG: SGNH/GDSL hydrolase family protein [Candidatus Pelagadaptatus aseana]|uniref:SGNH/GDSL hydrolase family protein n=1 Tax=Candidatus Pelagadaptatus aseana TaxID=3120508 RepID=UPI0039B1E1C7
MVFWFLLLPLCLLVLLAAQAVYTRKTAIRLPEAEGVRLNLNGGTQALLHVGESTVAGVGVPNIQQGLTANIISGLNASGGHWDWQVLGSNGARIGDVQDWSDPIVSPDVLVITFGVNDATKLTPIQRWRDNFQTCVDKFAGDNTQVLCTGVPPLNQFPLLPFPLNRVLGWRSKKLDRALVELCQSKGWTHLDLQFETIGHLMAEDGYHPNAEGYQAWGDEIAQRIRQIDFVR